jgi:hypothetical protein
MTRNPAGKLRRHRFFAAGDQVATGTGGRPPGPGFARKFMGFPAEAGLFLKKAF